MLRQRGRWVRTLTSHEGEEDVEAHFPNGIVGAIATTKLLQVFDVKGLLECHLAIIGQLPPHARTMEVILTSLFCPVCLCVRARVCLLAHAHPLCCGGKQFMCKLSMLSIWWAQEISHNPQVTPSDQLILIHIWLCIYRVGCCV